MNYIEKEKLIKADIASIENRVRHAFNQGYDLGYKEGKANCSKDSTGSTTKNDLGVDECISKQAVLNKILKFSVTDGRSVSVTGLWTEVNELPPVTPQTRQGHWIPVFQGDEIIDYRCSCCEFGNTFGKGTVGMNYCPRCGSRNEVEE